MSEQSGDYRVTVTVPDGREWTWIGYAESVLGVLDNAALAIETELEAAIREAEDRA